MSNESTDFIMAAPESRSSEWDGSERRRPADRREDDRRLDARRRAGIGEVMDDRRRKNPEGRRKSDRRTKQSRRAGDLE